MTAPVTTLDQRFSEADASPSGGSIGGLDVMVEGDAVAVTDEDTLRRLAAAWTQKWDGRWTYEARDGGFRHSADHPEVISVFGVTPVKVLAFGKGTFTHTRHRF